MGQERDAGRTHAVGQEGGQPILRRRSVRNQGLVGDELFAGRHQHASVTRVLLTFALCDRPHLERWCPTMLLKRLIGQLLEQNPLLVLEEPQLFNVRNFQKLKEMQQVWQRFEKIAADQLTCHCYRSHRLLQRARNHESDTQSDEPGSTA